MKTDDNQIPTFCQEPKGSLQRCRNLFQFLIDMNTYGLKGACLPDAALLPAWIRLGNNIASCVVRSIRSTARVSTIALAMRRLNFLHQSSRARQLSQSLTPTPVFSRRHAGGLIHTHVQRTVFPGS